MDASIKEKRAGPESEPTPINSDRTSTDGQNRGRHSRARQRHVRHPPVAHDPHPSDGPTETTGNRGKGHETQSHAWRSVVNQPRLFWAFPQAECRQPRPFAATCVSLFLFSTGHCERPARLPQHSTLGTSLGSAYWLTTPRPLRYRPGPRTPQPTASTHSSYHAAGSGLRRGRDRANDMGQSTC